MVEREADVRLDRRSSDHDQWYTNKELHKMIDDLKGRMNETSSLLKQYNGLVPRMAKLEQAMTDLARAHSECLQRQQGRYDVGKAIREWGGWILAVLLGTKTLGLW